MKVFIAGHTGMVGRAVIQLLKSTTGFIPVYPDKRLDYRDSSIVNRVIHTYSPDAVVVCAAKVGGIAANINEPADFIYDNLTIQSNFVKSAHQAGDIKMILLGSSCIYPRHCNQPMREEDFLSGAYEPTNRAYAVAKTAGIELARAYKSQHNENFYALMPPNLYGPHDNYSEQDSHVIAALMRKAMLAPDGGELKVWGSGKPMREIMHVTDAASAVLHSLKHLPADSCSPYGFLNCGTGEEVSIGELAQLVVDVSGKDLEIALDSSKPDGMPRKVMDSSRMNALGWEPKIKLIDGLRSTWKWLTNNWESPTLSR